MPRPLVMVMGSASEMLPISDKKPLATGSVPVDPPALARNVVPSALEPKALELEIKTRPALMLVIPV